MSIGAAGYSLVPISNSVVAPMGVGAGVTLGNDRVFQLTAEWRADLDRAEETTNRYGVGAEVMLGNLVPLRAGWAKDETLDTSWWSLGARASSPVVASRSTSGTGRRPGCRLPPRRSPRP